MMSGAPVRAASGMTALKGTCHGAEGMIRVAFRSDGYASLGPQEKVGRSVNRGGRRGAIWTACA